MKNLTENLISRRRFLGTASAGLTGISVLPGLASCAKKAVPTAAEIKLGFIGMGRQSMFLLKGFLQLPGVTVVAGCDVYGVKRERFKKRVEKHNKSNKIEVTIETYENYKDLLAREDIQAVVIAVPDHHHAMIAIAACKAGKDIYLEKPLTFTINEGMELRKAVRENKVILGVGSQQRSDPNFQHAVQLVKDGKLGRIIKAHAYVGAPPKPYDLSEEPIPADLNWDAWKGPLPADIHYNSQLDPPITINPEQDENIWGAWRWYKEMGGGFTTDWGAHMFDIVQWGLGMDNSGPVEISPIGDGTEFISYTYASGTVMTTEPFDEKLTKGVKFIGENGWLEVSREHFNASDSQWIPGTANTTGDGPYETKIPHQVNFIESIRQRKRPAVPVEVGHRTCTMCTLGNIACELKRTVKWDPENESFVDDTDGAATNLMQYQYREGWSLL